MTGTLERLAFVLIELAPVETSMLLTLAIAAVKFSRLAIDGEFPSRHGAPRNASSSTAEKSINKAHVHLCHLIDDRLKMKSLIAGIKREHGYLRDRRGEFDNNIVISDISVRQLFAVTLILDVGRNCLHETQ